MEERRLCPDRWWVWALFLSHALSQNLRIAAPAEIDAHMGAVNAMMCRGAGAQAQCRMTRLVRVRSAKSWIVRFLYERAWISYSMVIVYGFEALGTPAVIAATDGTRNVY